jgi:hypothetical protein
LNVEHFEMIIYLINYDCRPLMTVFMVIIKAKNHMTTSTFIIFFS